MILRISGTALQGPCIHLPTSTATPTPMADESMADESMADEFRIHGGQLGLDKICFFLAYFAFLLCSIFVPILVFSVPILLLILVYN